MESLTLSEADVSRFERSLRALLSPLEHEHPDGWRRSVNDAVRELLGADMATFQLPTPNAELMYSDEVDLRVRRRYVPTLSEGPPLVSLHALERTVDLEVCNRRTLWGDRLPWFYDSAYYHELVVPARAFDMLCAATRPDGADSGTFLYLHHGSRRGPRFGERGFRLLRMLYPAFEAGVRTFHRFHARRRDLFLSLDVLEEAVCLFDVDGKLLHRNPGFDKLGLGERDERALAEEASRLARSLSALCRARRSRDGVVTSGATRRAWAGSRRFTLAGSLLEGMAVGSRPLVLVTVREEGSPRGTRASDGHIQTVSTAAIERFGLTPREAEVAALLVRRRTNREIARELGISPHTARHHVESVLAKLGVHSRRDVAGKFDGARRGRA